MSENDDIGKIKNRLRNRKRDVQINDQKNPKIVEEEEVLQQPPKTVKKKPKTVRKKPIKSSSEKNKNKQIITDREAPPDIPMPIIDFSKIKNSNTDNNLNSDNNNKKNNESDHKNQNNIPQSAIKSSRKRNIRKREQKGAANKLNENNNSVPASAIKVPRTVKKHRPNNEDQKKKIPSTAVKRPRHPKKLEIPEKVEKIEKPPPKEEALVPDKHIKRIINKNRQIPQKVKEKEYSDTSDVRIDYDYTSSTNSPQQPSQPSQPLLQAMPPPPPPIPPQHHLRQQQQQQKHVVAHERHPSNDYSFQFPPDDELIDSKSEDDNESSNESGGSKGQSNDQYGDYYDKSEEDEEEENKYDDYGKYDEKYDDYNDYDDYKGSNNKSNDANSSNKDNSLSNSDGNSNKEEEEENENKNNEYEDSYGYPSYDESTSDDENQNNANDKVFLSPIHEHGKHSFSEDEVRAAAGGGTGKGTLSLSDIFPEMNIINSPERNRRNSENTNKIHNSDQNVLNDNNFNQMKRVESENHVERLRHRIPIKAPSVFPQFTPKPLSIRFPKYLNKFPINDDEFHDFEPNLTKKEENKRINLVTPINFQIQLIPNPPIIDLDREFAPYDVENLIQQIKKQ
ncbi:hypothetical protein TRFO_21827 [Tritrichomonas foetus]|uniref:Uncharacterized protein n=1 Tax=Tritrichomonas foetus TaxID=1144522 RepID=A0A1J4KE96_9EUKA|nr:hypothetical protein TRFO_21827 [Tritrichomonas foetus]|eukprot:OHT09330.1 hypothetical protein TRFO_21827 [Tritrichomonas foetus]